MKIAWGWWDGPMPTHPHSSVQSVSYDAPPAKPQLLDQHGQPIQRPAPQPASPLGFLAFPERTAW